MKKCAFFEKWCIQNVNYGELSTTQVVRALFVLLLIYQRKRRGNSSRDWTGSGRNAWFWKYKKNYGELSTTQVVRALFVLLLIYQRKRRGNSSRDWTGSGRNAWFWKYKKDCKSFDLQSLKSDRRGSNPRPRPWQGRTLPAEPLSRLFCVPLGTIYTILQEFLSVNNFFEKN